MWGPTGRSSFRLRSGSGLRNRQQGFRPYLQPQIKKEYLRVEQKRVEYGT
jgi:hypothetical protein